MRRRGLMKIFDMVNGKHDSCSKNIIAPPFAQTHPVYFPPDASASHHTDRKICFAVKPFRVGSPFRNRCDALSTVGFTSSCSSPPAS
jgi:hypothetical protein